MEESLQSPREYSWVNIGRISLAHASLLGLYWTGWSWFSVLAFLLLFYLRLFAISGVFHRYYSHRSYEMQRWFQLVVTAIGCSAGQKGPLSWASIHRRHHLYSDRPGDPHSPMQNGLFYSHLGWLLKKEAIYTTSELMDEYEAQPEIIFLNRYHYLPTLALMLGLYGLGAYLESHYAQLGVTPWQLLLWGGLASTLLLLHATCVINSLMHFRGSRAFDTNDHSNNVWWLWPITIGENYHNNHHRHPSSANAALKRGQVDLIFGLLRCLGALGFVSAIRDARNG